MLIRYHTCVILAVLVAALLTPAVRVAAESSADLLWYKHQGAHLRDLARSVAMLPDGSVLVHGWVEDYWAPGETLVKPPSTGLRVLFLAKYSPLGALQWLKIGGSAHCDEGGHISALSDGTCVMGGTYGYAGAWGHFGYGEANYTYLMSFGKGTYIYDIAIAKYNPDGTLQWARRAGSNKYDECTDIGIAPDGSCFVTGFVSGTALFGDGDGVADNDVTIQVGESDWEKSFLAWYDTNGILGWAVEGNYGQCLAVQADGTCLIQKDGNLLQVTAGGTENAVDASAAGTIFDLHALPDGGFMAFSRQNGVFRYGSGHTLVWQAPVAGHRFAGSADGKAFVFNQTTGAVTGIGTDGSILWSRVVGERLRIEEMAAAPDGATFALAGGPDYSYPTTLFTGSETVSLTQRGSGDIFLGVFSGETRYYFQCGAQGYGSACLSPQKTYYTAGEAVRISAEPFFEGYEFSHWEGDLSGETGPVVSMTVAGDLNATAVFVAGPGVPEVPAAGCGGLLLAAAWAATMGYRRLRRSRLQ